MKKNEEIGEMKIPRPFRLSDIPEMQPWLASYASSFMNTRMQARARTKRNIHPWYIRPSVPSLPLPIPFIIAWNERERYLRKIWVISPSRIEGSFPSTPTPFSSAAFSLTLLPGKGERERARFLTKRFKTSELWATSLIKALKRRVTSQRRLSHRVQASVVSRADKADVEGPSKMHGHEKRRTTGSTISNVVALRKILRSCLTLFFFISRSLAFILLKHPESFF